MCHIKNKNVIRVTMNFGATWLHTPDFVLTATPYYVSPKSCWPWRQSRRSNTAHWISGMIYVITYEWMKWHVCEWMERDFCGGFCQWIAGCHGPRSHWRGLTANTTYVHVHAVKLISFSQQLCWCCSLNASEFRLCCCCTNTPCIVTVVVLSGWEFIILCVVSSSLCHQYWRRWRRWYLGDDANKSVRFC